MRPTKLLPMYLTHLLLLVATPTAELTAAALAVESIDARGFPTIRLKFATPGVTVADPLGPVDIHVIEEERNVGIVSLSLQRDPIAISMVLDQSGSMDQAMDSLKKAARLFVDEMPPNAQMGIIAFDSEVKTLCTITADRWELRKALDRLQPYGATALFDACFEGLHHLDAYTTPGIAPRKVLVVFTDGRDQNAEGTAVQSRTTVKEVLFLARKLGIPLYMIGLGTSVDSQLMGKLATLAGGKFFHAPRPSDLTGIYRDLARLIGGSYHVAYRTPRPGPDGTKRTVVVRCTKKGLEAQSHGFYTAPKILAETKPVAYHALIKDPGGYTIPQIELYESREFAVGSPVEGAAGESEQSKRSRQIQRIVDLKIGPIWSDAARLSYEAAVLAQTQTVASLHRSRILAHRSLLQARHAVSVSADLRISLEPKLTAEERTFVLPEMIFREKAQTQAIQDYEHAMLTYHNNWADAVGAAHHAALEAAAAASLAAGITVDAAILGAEAAALGAQLDLDTATPGIASATEAAERGIRTGAMGARIGARGAEIGARALQNADRATRSLEQGMERFNGAMDADGRSTDEFGNAMDSYGDSLDAYGDAMDAAGDALDAAGDAVDAAGDAVDAAGDAVDGATNLSDRLSGALKEFGLGK